MPTANDITINSDPGVVSYVIGDFVGDKRADVLFADGQTWGVSDGDRAVRRLRDLELQAA